MSAGDLILPGTSNPKKWRSITTQTRSQSNIPNCCELEFEALQPTYEHTSKEFERLYQTPVTKIRSKFSTIYNCHGLTFLCRRAVLDEVSFIRTILSDDGYARVKPNEVLPGDIVLYVHEGDIQHSGIVVESDERYPLIISKWGQMQEAVHRVHMCPYFPCDILEYWRLDDAPRYKNT